MRNKLTATQVDAAKPQSKQYKLYDGGGLYLLVMPNGRKYWRMRYKFKGKENTASFGIYGKHPPRVSLKAARDSRDEAYRLLDKGIDINKGEVCTTFESVARDWHRMVSPKWQPEHADKVLKSLDNDVFPKLGKIPVQMITARDILETVKLISRRGAHDVASRVLQRITRVLTYAVVTGLIDINPAAGLNEYVHKPQGTSGHHPALRPDQMPDFMKAVKNSDMFLQTELALRFLMLTFVRTHEMRYALWEEIDFEAKTWVIPPVRMLKTKREHVVPLSTQAVDILKQLRGLSGSSELILPSRSNPLKPISENTVLFAIYRIGYKDQMTGHGFRTVASTWLNESGFNPDAVERQLSHGEPNKIRDAYNRADYMSERIKMMQAWADFLDICSDQKPKVTHIKFNKSIKGVTP